MSLNKKERYMGRPLRTRIDFAKTLSWYDFFHNQLIAFGKIKNDFGLAKLLCKDTEKSHESNLFKKYKFGLSTPQQEWIDIIDSKCIGSSNIINHSIWKNLKYRTTEEKLILIELNNLPNYIFENLIINGHIKDFNKSDLEKLAQYEVVINNRFNDKFKIPKDTYLKLKLDGVNEVQMTRVDITPRQILQIVGTDMGRNIVSIKKQKGTPNKYPRKAGMPVKRPII